MESAPPQGRLAWLPAELYPFESRYLRVTMMGRVGASQVATAWSTR
jgi:hypothetical protein